MSSTPSVTRKPNIASSACPFCVRHPNLAAQEETRPNDPMLQENFLTRSFIYSSWQQLLTEGLTRHRLLEFHARYKYLLMAHSPAHYKSLGNLLGSMTKGDDLDLLAASYFSELMTALKKAPPVAPTPTCCNTSAVTSSRPSAPKTNRKCRPSSANITKASCRSWCR